MRVLVLGAGIIGICTAWHLLERGHEVVVVERQGGPALETSFANGGQISVSYCEPWANRHAPGRVLHWMLRRDAPLLFRPQWPVGEGWQQWRWALKFLGQCNDAAFERNVAQLVALGAYSHESLKEIVRATGIEFQRLERGIAHYFTDPRTFDDEARAAEAMRRHGVDRRVVSREELLAIEPAYRSFAHCIVGGTYTATDESGDARVFTGQLALHCERRGALFLFGRDIERLEHAGGELTGVRVRDRATGGRHTMKADAVVVACGSYSAPLLRAVGVDLPIYPGKGYSATFPLLRPEAAPVVSTIDGEVKCAITRLGNELRVAGTIELAGFDTSLDTPIARARCGMLARRIEQVLPGVCDVRDEEQGGNPRYWTGLRPSTPSNVPFIGRTRLRGLWVNAGHGTLGWTHGAGSGRAIAALIDGERPAMDFRFLGFSEASAARRGN